VNTNMRIVAVEKHFTFPDILDRIDSATLTENGWPVPGTPVFKAINPPALAETGSGRIAAMDTSGVSMQVLSVPGPGAEIVSGIEGITIAKEFNDRMARLVAAQPKRFAGFAHLPMRNPLAAADELERAVTELSLKGALISGTVDGKFLDAPEFEPVLACAERLDVPLYIHPGVPPAIVRAAYYDGLPGPASFMLAIAGWGWHAETAVHILRLALSGVLDRHPRLKLVIGHMGEGLPTALSKERRAKVGIGIPIQSFAIRAAPRFRMQTR
jgi:predicted TIM-barrel fold metal-dependent hydrolase